MLSVANILKSEQELVEFCIHDFTNDFVKMNKNKLIKKIRKRSNFPEQCCISPNALTDES